MAAPGRIPFPEDPEDFDKDDRISYSKLDAKWILEESNGTEWEYNQAARKWMPSLDDSLLQAQQQTYGATVPSEPAATPANDQANNLKRKSEDQGNKTIESNNAKRSKKGDKQKAERKNSAVYISNLPPDCTTEEIVAVFSKYGVIAENLETGQPRVKLYQDSDGTPKGDGLVVYFRPESVHLAIQMLDDSALRPGENKGMENMRVQEAENSYKKKTGDEALKPENTKGKAKIRLQNQANKMRNKLTEWDDDDPSTLQQTSNRWDKVVILKHMFTLEEIEADSEAATEIAEDVKSEAEGCGPVHSVTLFDLEPAGVLSIRFENPQAARACVDLMNGRLFGGQRVEATIADGTERFKKTKVVKDDGDDEKRLKEFGDWIEGKDGSGEKVIVESQSAKEGDGVGPGGGEAAV